MSLLTTGRMETRAHFIIYLQMRIMTFIMSLTMELFHSFIHIQQEIAATKLLYAIVMARSILLALPLGWAMDMLTTVSTNGRVKL